MHPCSRNDGEEENSGLYDGDEIHGLNADGHVSTRKTELECSFFLDRAFVLNMS